MKKLLTTLTLLLALPFVAASLWAQPLPAGAVAPPPEMRAFTAAEALSAPVSPAREARPASAAQLKGKYLTYGYTTNNAHATYWTDIAPLSGDSVSIVNLMGKGTAVHGRYNAQTGILSVPSQSLFNDPEYGDFFCVRVDIDKKVYYPDADIEFTVNADGIMQTGNWGAFILSGQNKGLSTIRYREILYPARGVMTDYSQTKTDADSVRSYPVAVFRENDTHILVKNFYNYGADVVLTLNSDGSVNAARSPLAYGKSSSGSTLTFYNYAVNNYVSPTSLKLATTGVPGQYADSVITFNRWAVSSSTSVSAIYELLSHSTIKMPEPFAPFSVDLALSGSGTDQDPYLVTSAADLQSLSKAVNHNTKYTVSKKAFEGKYFRQTADIDMAEVQNFEPIGIATSSTFCGIYDGNGHSISNLTVNRRDNQNTGLFGIMGKQAALLNLTFINPTLSSTKTYTGTAAAQSAGIIRNVKVQGADISGSTSYVGGVVGSSTGIIDNVWCSGSVSANSFLGGIVGASNGHIYNAYSEADITLKLKSGIVGGIAGSVAGDTVVVRDCLFAGTVTDKLGSSTIGGIAGYMQMASVSACANHGYIYSKSVSNNTTAVGGIAGLFSAAHATDCHFSGRISATDAQMVAGLAAKLVKRTGSGTDTPSFANSLVTGIIDCPAELQKNEFTGSELEQFTLTNCYFGTQTSSRGSQQGGRTIAALTNGTPIEGFNTQSWQFAAGRYPVVKAFAETDQGILHSLPFILDEADDVTAVRHAVTLTDHQRADWHFLVAGKLLKQGHGMKIQDGKAIISATSAATDTLVATVGNHHKLAFLKVLPKEFDGEGTADSPYLVRSLKDILKISNAVDKQNIRYTGTHFRLMADLDLTGVDNFIGISAVGTQNAFNGIFDGNGHVIKNWIIDRCGLQNGTATVPLSSSYMVGFFLYTGEQAEVRNLTIDASCSVTAGSHVAPLISQNAGLVENCRNFAPVTGLYNETGGLVAANLATGILRNCYNGAAVKGGRQVVGGLAGINAGRMEGCQNDGFVLNDSISNYSPVIGATGIAGGLAGLNYGVITNCLGAGSVKARQIAGAITGENMEEGVITNTLATGIVFHSEVAGTQGAVTGRQFGAENSLQNVFYDAQHTSDTDGENMSLTGVTGLNTAILVSGSLPKGLDAPLWCAAKGRFPMLAAFQNLKQAIFNASTHVDFSTEGRTDTRFAMRRAAQISCPEGAALSLAQGKLSVSRNTLAVPSGVRAVSDTLRIVSAGMEKVIPLFAPGAILAKGDGSAQNPWLIEAAADWNTLLAYAAENNIDFRDESFSVTKNIDFGGSTLAPLGDGVTPFRGTLRGNNHSFSNISIFTTVSNAGLFASLGSEGRVQDLVIDGTSSAKGYSNVGMVAGRNAGVIEHCVNKATVQSAYTYAGGMAGYVVAGGRFLNCQNYGAITSDQGQAGGIAGGNGSDIGGLIRGCENHGTIVSGERSAGGIIGSGRVAISNCVNHGNISSVSTYAGGIVGYHTYTFPIDSCENRGDVTSQAGAAGGIAGYLFASAPLSHCVNYGDVTSGKTWAGGIVGNSYRAPVSVVNSVNYGNITATTTHAGGIIGNLIAATDSTANTLSHLENHGVIQAGGNYSGGIVGQMGSYGTLSHASNYAPVTAKGNYAGGIGGNVSSETLISQCRNSAPVKGAIYVGGIAGGFIGQMDLCCNSGSVTADKYTAGGLGGTTLSTTTVKAAISRSFNTGSVQSLGTTATTNYNIGGILGGGNVKLSSVYNVGDVSAYKCAGGLVGLAVKGSASGQGTSVKDSYNVGSVTCLESGNESTCGHLIGASAALTYVSYTNSYFDKQMAAAVSYPLDTAATAIMTRDFSTDRLGADFVQLAPNTYPVLKEFATDSLARLYASALRLADGNTRHNVVSRFFLAAPDGISWSSDHFNLSDGRGRWNDLSVGQTYPLYANFGTYQRPFLLTVNATSGLSAADADIAGQTAAILWYAPDGTRLPAARKGFCIKVSVYPDGRRTTTKVLVP